MKIFLASPRGFCAGVVRAIDIVERALMKYGSPLYIKHQIVHNKYVVASLERKGVITVENVQDIPDESIVIVSAHGSSPDDFNEAKKKKLTVIDATCPLVTKVHNEAIKYKKEGFKVLLVGHRGHQEVRGTMGHTEMYLVDEREEFSLPDWDDNDEVAVLSQTTLSVDDTKNVINTIKNKYRSTKIRNDICYATTNRQDSVKELAKQVEVVLVIGSSNSSNCNRLKEVALSQGTKAYLINGSDELSENWFNGVNFVGITSGASTPDNLVEEVINKLKPTEVTTLKTVEENVSFVLPKEFQ